MEIQDSQFSILTLFLTMYITLYIYVSSTVLGEDTVFVSRLYIICEAKIWETRVYNLTSLFFGFPLIRRE